eukprot:m.929429 g.929429  ORF g.929429 m.929429 type:complete len:122 (+) comp23781_c0_seq32:513-878(+)
MCPSNGERSPPEVESSSRCAPSLLTRYATMPKPQYARITEVASQTGAQRMIVPACRDHQQNHRTTTPSPLREVSPLSRSTHWQACSVLHVVVPRRLPPPASPAARGYIRVCGLGSATNRET